MSIVCRADTHSIKRIICILQKKRTLPFVCVCVCVCVRYIYLYVFIYIYICVCVCMCIGMKDSFVCVPASVEADISFDVGKKGVYIYIFIYLFIYLFTLYI
eukprot:GHVR01163631.1.p1 GENE.GHVR01163631.1~~GHVR01163631.1.p1  ORF type:complete len:101 (-),score=25.46 GHVR01163631.1:20-322(-)